VQQQTASIAYPNLADCTVISEGGEAEDARIDIATRPADRTFLRRTTSKRAPNQSHRRKQIEIYTDGRDHAVREAICAWHNRAKLGFVVRKRKNVL